MQENRRKVSEAMGKLMLSADYKRDSVNESHFNSFLNSGGIATGGKERKPNVLALTSRA